MTKLDWQALESARKKAGRRADAVIAELGINGRVEPLEIARTRKDLKCRGHNLGNAYDGKLAYAKQQDLFMMIYNTKYDELPGVHHPRTRFSICHELGHYFLDEHNEFLRKGGAPHESKGEFRGDEREKEADAFAASLLLPTRLVTPIITAGEVSLSMIGHLARTFGASELATAFRCIRLSDLPCGLSAIVDGNLAWTFCSERLIDGGCFPGKRALTSEGAQSRWSRFQDGEDLRCEADGYLRDWFQLFQRDEELHDVMVTESFLPVPEMDMLAVVITMDDESIHGEGEDDQDDYDD